MFLRRRRLIATTSLAAASLGLPRIAIGQVDQRPSITIAVQQIANSASLEPLRKQSNVGQRVFSFLFEPLIMQNLLGMSAPELGKVFIRWNEGDLDSYLIQITADILQQKDPVHKDGYLVDYILDTAGQKGTGKWTSVNALDMGIPANSIAEAVFARFLSALKEERVEASGGELAAGPRDGGGFRVVAVWPAP